jgi:hypothetical protein
MIHTGGSVRIANYYTRPESKSNNNKPINQKMNDEKTT